MGRSVLEEARSTTYTRYPQRRQAKPVTWSRQFGIDALFLLPAFILFTMVVMYPILSGLYYGFTDWDGINPHIGFIGLTNFIKMFQDTVLWITVRNMVIFALVTTLVQMVLGLVLALALHGSKRIFATLRVLYLLPIILGGLAIALAFRYIYNPSIGLLNALLAGIGHSAWGQDWLGNVHLVLGSIIAANAWQWVGFTMIIFLAGLQAVPTELHDAANIDGANSWQHFWAVTWPLLAPSTTVNLLLTIIGSLKVFDIILVMTGGGPGYASESIVVYLFSRAFGNTTSAPDSYGYPAAISIVLSLAIFLISLGALKILLRREVEF